MTNVKSDVFEVVSQSVSLNPGYKYTLYFSHLHEGGVHAYDQTLVVSAGDALLAGHADVAGPGAQPAPGHLAALGPPPEEGATRVAATS